MAYSKALMLVDGVYGQRFLNQICSPVALFSSRKRAMHGTSKKYDKKKDEDKEENKAIRRNVLLNLDMALDEPWSPRPTTGVTSPNGKTSGVTGGKAAAPQEGVDKVDNDS